MPELPEVETIVRRLAEALPGRRVARAEVRRANVVEGPVARFVGALEGAPIRAVGRRGKYIVATLEGDRIWVTHLRMSGRYRVEPPGLRDTEPAYTRAVFDLDDGGRLLYVDPRTLGLLEIVPAVAWRKRAAELGPEPLDPDFTPAVLRARLAASRVPVKPWLLDQTRVAGLGNIYACEALWRARVSPRRRARNVGPARAGRLHAAIVAVLSEAIGESGTSLGATYLDWADGEGERGRFRSALAVYGREGEPCPRCGEAVRRIVQGQRSTWFCPRCQR